MATVKIKFRKSVGGLFDYVVRGMDRDDPIDFESCTKESLPENFKASQRLATRKSPNEAIHIIQSWGPEESKLVEPWRLNKMGRQMCERLFPGHSFSVITHTDTGKTHNHIASIQ